MTDWESFMLFVLPLVAAIVYIGKRGGTDEWDAFLFADLTILATWAGFQFGTFWLMPASALLFLLWAECGIKPGFVWAPVESIIPHDWVIIPLIFLFFLCFFLPIVWTLGVLNLGRRWLARQMIPPAPGSVPA